MRPAYPRLRRRACLSLAATLCGLALSAGMVGAPAADARSAGSPATAASGLTWHQLGLVNHWKPDGSVGTGNPSWATRGGVVYLSGSIRNGKHGARHEFAVLPPAARPAHYLYITVYTADGTQGFLFIKPDGKMEAFGQHAVTFTSLAGVSYPARSMGSHQLALQNGWLSGEVAFNTGAPSYEVSGGVVYLSGSLFDGTSSTFATLPPAARPASNLYLTVWTWDGAPGILYVGTDGVLEAYAGKAVSLTSLAGVSFPAASVTTTALGLLNGWTSGCCGGGTPSYVVMHGIVYLSGSLSQSPAGSDFFARLPPGARPAHALYIQVYAYGGAMGVLFISPSGYLEAYSPAPQYAPAYTSLAAVSFPVGS